MTMTKPETPQELRDRWTAALRSKDFSQTTGALQDGEGYCCLGVLCHIYDEHLWTQVFEEETAERGQVRFNSLPNVILADEDVCSVGYGDFVYADVECPDGETVVRYASLPHEIAKAAGFSTSVGELDSSNKRAIATAVEIGMIGVDVLPEQLTLAQLNDNGATFEQIADVIDAIADDTREASHVA